MADPIEDTLAMIADYMERGFLENIADMLRHDRTLFASIPLMISDQRSRVRIGAVALVETLKPQYPGMIASLARDVRPALGNPDATVRGDAVYLLSVIGGSDALGILREALEAESNPAVREAIRESLDELEGDGLK